MKSLILVISLAILTEGRLKSSDIPEFYKEVDQILWVVSDVETTMLNYRLLGFDQFKDLGLVEIKSLVHRSLSVQELKDEMSRLDNLGVAVLDKISISTPEGELAFVLMDTEAEGKYVLGFTFEANGLQVHTPLCDQNRLEMTLNQYAFAIKDPQPVSAYWERIGLPALAISHPELGNPMYYGKPADHKLIQGWQRHGSVAYEWCIPVKPPIVYEDHIHKHGEGIHHLAFSVQDMDLVLEDYTSQGFVVSMGGTWGEEGKPGSGRYEYIDLEHAGGLTMELLWSYRE